MKLNQHSHCRLLYAADIGRNREYARPVAQNPHENMAPAGMAGLSVDCVDVRLTPQPLLTGSNIHPTGAQVIP